VNVAESIVIEPGETVFVSYSEYVSFSGVLTLMWEGTSQITVNLLQNGAEVAVPNPYSGTQSFKLTNSDGQNLTLSAGFSNILSISHNAMAPVSMSLFLHSETERPYNVESSSDGGSDGSSDGPLGENAKFLIVVIAWVSFSITVWALFAVYCWYRKRRRSTRVAGTVQQRVLASLGIGIPKAEINDRFPTRTPSKLKEFVLDQSCPVCLEVFKSSERVRQLTCGHVFHKN
jgi:hypothetical protein